MVRKLHITPVFLFVEPVQPRTFNATGLAVGQSRLQAHPVLDVPSRPSRHPLLMRRIADASLSYRAVTVCQMTDLAT